MTIDWTRVRASYPALWGRVFLNSATFGQLSARTVEALTQHLAARDRSACSDFLSWFDDHDRLRSKLALLINAQASDIAFLPNACSALAILLHGLPWQDGDEVITLEGEFPNNIYAPHFHRARLLEVPCEHLLGSITPRTRLVALSAVNYSTGFRAPLAEISAELRRRNILFYVDATQMLGALRFDWQAIQPSVLAVNCYKWMLAPNGIAFMAVHPDLRPTLPPLTVGWRSHHDWRNVNNLHAGPAALVESAEKYEGGMLPSALLYALEAAVDQLLELGPENVEARVLSLAAQLRQLLRDLGAEPLPYDDTAIVAARFPGRDGAEIAAALREHNVLVSARHGLLRVSTHLYNDESDLAGLRRALEAVLA